MIRFNSFFSVSFASSKKAETQGAFTFVLLFLCAFTGTVGLAAGGKHFVQGGIG